MNGSAIQGPIEAGGMDEHPEWTSNSDETRAEPFFKGFVRGG
ncbi:MAG: hypothetical protein ACJA16_003947 [Akkermansiaceae bacterium]|jgi:hypothetical protein